MQATIDLREDHAELLDRLGAEENLSRKELVERVVADYLQQHSLPSGTRKGGEMDGLNHSRESRENWEPDMDADYVREKLAEVDRVARPYLDEAQMMQALDVLCAKCRVDAEADQERAHAD